MRALLLGILLAPAAAVAQAGSASAPLVYGADDRTFVGEGDPDVAAVAALVPRDRLVESAAGIAMAPTTLAERLGGPLCAGERFVGEPSLADCTAVLVADDAVLTAHHCVPDAAACAALRVVFGFRREGDGLRELEAGDVYGCVAREDVDPARDRVRLRLDRATDREAPRRARASAEDPVRIVGHPAGAPAMATSAVVSAREAGGLVLYADLEEGSSGSPVFAADGALVGVVVAGDGPDYEWTGECFRTRTRFAGEGVGAWATDVVPTESGCAAAGPGAAPTALALGTLMALAIGRGRRRSRARGASGGCDQGP